MESSMNAPRRSRGASPCVSIHKNEHRRLSFARSKAIMDQDYNRCGNRPSGRETLRMANQTKGICVVGAGRAGMIHARNFQSQVPGFTVVSVVDPSEEAARRAC